MPTVFDIFGLRGYFYSGDHYPMHVHVVKAGKEVVIELGDELRIRENNGMSKQDVAKALSLVENFKTEIIAEWNKYHKQ